MYNIWNFLCYAYSYSLLHVLYHAFYFSLCHSICRPCSSTVPPPYVPASFTAITSAPLLPFSVHPALTLCLGCVFLPSPHRQAAASTALGSPPLLAFSLRPALTLRTIDVVFRHSYRPLRPPVLPCRRPLRWVSLRRLADSLRRSSTPGRALHQGSQLLSSFSETDTPTAFAPFLCRPSWDFPFSGLSRHRLTAFIKEI